MFSFLGETEKSFRNESLNFDYAVTIPFAVSLHNSIAQFAKPTLHFQCLLVQSKSIA